MQSCFGKTRWLAFACAMLTGLVAWAGDSKIRLQLIWGTDEVKPPANKDYKPVSSEMRDKFINNLRWKHYYVVKSEDKAVGKEACRVDLSERCRVGLNPAGKGLVEVQIYNLMGAKPSDPVFTEKISLESLQKGHAVAIGSNSKDRWDDAWLVLVTAAD